MTTPPPASPGAYPPARRRRADGRRIPRRRAAALVAAVALAVAGMAGCGDPARTAGAPVLTVVTGLWPLAQAIGQVGQDNVRVLDVVPPGQDPRTWHPTAAARHEMQTAGVVVQMGTTLQPAFSAAAAGDRQTLTLRAANPYIWLNPYAFEAVAAPIRDALDRADPEASATFANGYANLMSELSSDDNDYQSTLGDCPHTNLYTVDDAFAVLNSRYQVHVVALQPGQVTDPIPKRSTEDAEEATIRRLHIQLIYNETWSAYDALLPVQQATGVRIATTSLDPLLGIPPGGFPAGLSTYYDLIEHNLQAVSQALDCPNPNDQT